MLKTDLPIIYVYNGTIDLSRKFMARSMPEILDILRYSNAKSVFVEYKLSSSLYQVYEALIQQICQAQRSAVIKQLSLARADPDQLAYNYYGGPGVTGVKVGEVVYILYCIPVVVTPRHTDCLLYTSRCV